MPNLTPVDSVAFITFVSAAMASLRNSGLGSFWATTLMRMAGAPSAAAASAAPRHQSTSCSPRCSKRLAMHRAVIF